MNLLLDQGLPRTAVEGFQAARVDAVHTASVGLSHAGDEEILAYARQQDMVLATLDADFHALLALSGGFTAELYARGAERRGASGRGEHCVESFPSGRAPRQTGSRANALTEARAGYRVAARVTVISAATGSELE